jgi:hypothetical protein
MAHSRQTKSLIADRRLTEEYPWGSYPEKKRNDQAEG